MTIPRLRFRVLAASALVTVAAGALASCAADRPPEVVSARNPSVTYKYRGDQELLRANQQAAAFCNQYGAAPRSANLTNNTDGTNTVIFECVKPGTAATTALTPSVPLPPANPALSYTYRTDNELLDASRRADAYCMQHGQRMVAPSNIVTNVDGSRSVSFQCGPTIAVVP